jgi:hypothetical protein
MEGGMEEGGREWWRWGVKGRGRDEEWWWGGKTVRMFSDVGCT